MTAKHIQEAWDKLRQERDELAAQVEVMRAALEYCRRWPDLDAGGPLADKIDAALALPNTAAAILRQRDADLLRKKAMEWIGVGCPSGPEAAQRLMADAEELERKVLAEIEAGEYLSDTQMWQDLLAAQGARK